MRYGVWSTFVSSFTLESIRLSSRAGNALLGRLLELRRVRRVDEKWMVKSLINAWSKYMGGRRRRRMHGTYATSVKANVGK